MIIECKNPSDIVATFSVMQELRPHFTDREEYVAKVAQMQRDHGFRLIAYIQSEICAGLMGFTVETRLAFGKIIYVADLVTSNSHRSKGIGKALLDFIKKEAVLLDCQHILLDSGTHRVEAHRFYLRENFLIRAFNFRFPMKA
ncbi:MAG: GNAT family N-acetyltransferase [Alphaproteobacteria bacterium]